MEIVKRTKEVSRDHRGGRWACKEASSGKGELDSKTGGSSSKRCAEKLPNPTIREGQRGRGEVGDVSRAGDYSKDRVGGGENGCLGFRSQRTEKSGCAVTLLHLRERVGLPRQPSAEGEKWKSERRGRPKVTGQFLR